MKHCLWNEIKSCTIDGPSLSQRGLTFLLNCEEIGESKTYLESLELASLVLFWKLKRVKNSASVFLISYLIRSFVKSTYLTRKFFITIKTMKFCNSSLYVHVTQVNYFKVSFKRSVTLVLIAGHWWGCFLQGRRHCG